MNSSGVEVWCHPLQMTMSAFLAHMTATLGLRALILRVVGRAVVTLDTRAQDKPAQVQQRLYWLAMITVFAVPFFFRGKVILESVKQNRIVF